MTDIQKRLFALADEEYADFQAKLTPTVPREKFIGVRVPKVRLLAKEFIKEPEHMDFLKILPHEYYDENMLHGLLISEIRDYDEAISLTDAFLPFVDNWAVCDIMSPKCFKKNKEKLIIKIREWAKSDLTYTARFGIEMLMSHFLDADFKKEYLDIAAGVSGEDYYIKMMIAWFFATALTKKWDAALPYITEERLPVWVHNKTISKARESYRITPEQKELLNTYKIKAEK